MKLNERISEPQNSRNHDEGEVPPLFDYSVDPDGYIRPLGILGSNLPTIFPPHLLVVENDSGYFTFNR